LKSIGGGLAEILKGPFGWGNVEYPFKMQMYSPESGDETTNWQTLSLIDEGSNFTLTKASVPSKLSHAGTVTVGVSRVKSVVTTGIFAFGSTLAGCFSPIFSTRQV